MWFDDEGRVERLEHSFPEREVETPDQSDPVDLEGDEMIRDGDGDEETEAAAGA